MTLPQNQYGDPSLVAERNQEREIVERKRVEMTSCHGCVDLARVFEVQYCLSNHSKSGSSNLRKCQFFKRSVI